MRVNILKGTYLEFKKMKKKKVLIIALLFTLVTVVWTMSVSNNFYSRGETSPSDMWLYGLTSIAQINALLSPIFLSITASKVSEIEHRGATLKILLTRQSRANLYLSKLSDDKIAEINRIFVENGLKVYRIELIKKSLEEIFLDLTGKKVRI